MQVVYAHEQAPESFSKSIFLAGPSPRQPDHPNWRPAAIKALEALKYDGVVFVPLPRDGEWKHGYVTQVEWETAHLNMADEIVFWIPRDMEKLPALTTNVEFGMWLASGKVILGFPADAQHVTYLAHHAARERIPVRYDLEETLRVAVDRIGAGTERVGGERMIPLHIWRLQAFQEWITAQKNAGNRLDGARVLWSHRVGANKDRTFAYAIHVNVFVAKEGRHKSNEIILARPDISAVVAYRLGERTIDTEIVLVREFRSTARTPDGFIRELPSGSSWEPEPSPKDAAANELREETGLLVDPSDLRLIGWHQLSGTFSTHQARVYAIELTEQQMESMREQQRRGIQHGIGSNETDERTYVEVHRLENLIYSGSDIVDWSTIGMIMKAVYG